MAMVTGIQGDLYRHLVLDRTGDVAAGAIGTGPGTVPVPDRVVTEGVIFITGDEAAGATGAGPGTATVPGSTVTEGGQ